MDIRFIQKHLQFWVRICRKTIHVNWLWIIDIKLNNKIYYYACIIIWNKKDFAEEIWNELNNSPQGWWLNEFVEWVLQETPPYLFRHREYGDGITMYFLRMKARRLYFFLLKVLCSMYNQRGVYVIDKWRRVVLII